MRPLFGDPPDLLHLLEVLARLPNGGHITTTI
jgi:hypothetical protein